MVSRKKFSRVERLSIHESTNRIENHIEHLLHGTDPSPTRSEFLAAYSAATPSVLLCPRHSFPFSPGVCDNAARKSHRFSWISRNHRPKGGLQPSSNTVDPENVKCVKLDPELLPLTTV